MSRYLGSACKLCRREGEKLFLKGGRCNFGKCSFDKRSYAPGQHGQRSAKVSDYGRQLREKQKLRRSYGILEKQFRRYFRMAERQSGITGENLLKILESRLDNIVYRFGFAASRSEARQLVSHGHFLVNGKPVNIPSYLVQVGDIVEAKEKSREILPIQRSIEAAQQRGASEWLDIDFERVRGTVRTLPTREQLPQTIQEQLIVELYSR